MTFPVPRRAALSSLALAFITPYALAEAATEPVTAAVVVTATRAPQAAVDVLSDHVVIGAEDIAVSGANSVVDLLQQQRGVEVFRNGGPGANASVIIRGADSRQNVVLVDGVRIGSSTTGAANWSALPLANVERIEIVYGPLAAVYGADAVGGVIQIFTKAGKGPAQVSAFVGAGSDKARTAQAGISGATAGEHPVSYSLSVAREEDEGISATRFGLSSYNADKDGYRRDSASGQLGIALARGHEAGLLFMHSRLEGQYDTSANYNSRTEQEIDNVSLYSRHQLSSAWRLVAQASRARDRAATFANATPTGISRIETTQTTYSIRNDIALGSDLLQLSLEQREEDVVSGSTAALTRARTTNSLAAAYTAKRAAHLASISARRDSSEYGVKVTGGLGYGYRITPQLRANVSAGTSFRAPTFNELYFPGFGVSTNRPEQGRNAEAGLVYNDGRSEASAVYYRNRLTDLLVNTSPCPVRLVPASTLCAQNVNHATLEGLTIGARSQFGALDVNASMDFQDPRDDTLDKTLARRARRHASVGARYHIGAVDLGVSAQVSGKRFDDAANRNVLGGYGVLNLFASYRFSPEWQAELRLNNALDKHYELARYYSTAGRQVFAGLRYGIR